MNEHGRAREAEERRNNVAGLQPRGEESGEMCSADVKDGNGKRE